MTDDDAELQLPEFDKRVKTVRFWGECGRGGMHEGAPCQKCGERPASSSSSS